VPGEAKSATFWSTRRLAASSMETKTISVRVCVGGGLVPAAPPPHPHSVGLVSPYPTPLTRALIHTHTQTHIPPRRRRWASR
jgi:hypothetical protein